MRTVGRMTILSPDEVPALIEHLRKRLPLSAEELDQRRQVSARIDQLREEILAENGAIGEDTKGMLRWDRGEEPPG